MEIATIRHKALRVFAESGRTKDLPANSIDRLRNILAYLDAVTGPEELCIPPNFGAHVLIGDRAGTWSLIVTKNWRMTFPVDAHGLLTDLDIEDYH